MGIESVNMTSTTISKFLKER